jgi:hypothetical protein
MTTSESRSTSRNGQNPCSKVARQDADPVLRPLFRSNHSWTIKRGQERILAYLGES